MNHRSDRGVGYTVALMIWLFLMGGLIGNKIGHEAAKAKCTTTQAPLMSTSSTSELLALADKVRNWTPEERSPLTFIARERRMIEDALRLAATPKAGVDREVIALKVQNILATELGVDSHRDIVGTGPASYKIADALLPSVLGGVDQPSIADGQQCNEQSEQSLSRAAEPSIPTDPVQAFAYLVSKCGSGLLLELVAEGKSDTQARNQIVHYFLDFAAGEACRIARRQGREPDTAKWGKAVFKAFERAIKRTDPSLPQTDSPPPDNAGLVNGGGR